jgi:hypothetical protein
LGDDLLRVDIGVFLPAIDTHMRVDSATLGAGTDISLENDLALDDKLSIARLGGYYRFARRHRLYLGNYRMKRDSSAVLQRDIQFQDAVFPAGTTVVSDISLEVTEVRYLYSLWQRYDRDLAISFGAHWVNADTNLTGAGGIVQEYASVSGPLPAAGLEFVYAYTPRVLFSARADYFSLSAGDFDGSMRNARLAVEYYSNKRRDVGLGFGYNYFRMNADVASSTFQGHFEWIYSGVQVYTVVGF